MTCEPLLPSRGNAALLQWSKYLGLWNRYLAEWSFPEPIRFVQSELGVWQVRSPARRFSEWPRRWWPLAPRGPESPDAGLVVTSGEARPVSEDEAGELETRAPLGSLTCFNGGEVLFN